MEKKDCIYYDGRLVIKNVPYIKFKTPAPTGETEAKDNVASLVVSIAGERYKQMNERPMLWDYEDLKEQTFVKNRLEELYAEFS